MDNQYKVLQKSIQEIAHPYKAGLYELYIVLRDEQKQVCNYKGCFSSNMALFRSTTTKPFPIKWGRQN